MDKSKDEGREEVYEKYHLSTMPFFRRACTLLYVAWLFVQGFINAFPPLGGRRLPATLAIGIELSMMYFIIGGLLFVILHSYLGRRLPKTLYRFLVFAHQLALVGISAWRYVRSETQDHWTGTGARFILLSFCALAEIGGFVSDIIETYRNGSLTKTRLQ